MKIYYSLPDKVDQVEAVSEDVMDFLKENLQGVAARTAVELIQMLPGISKKYSIAFLESMKFKIMWSLRSIEQEIIEEGGMIVIDRDVNVSTNNFSPMLTSKIRSLIDEGFQQYPYPDN